jgi:uncharacterized protein YgiM (DUF1202 family)
MKKHLWIVLICLAVAATGCSLTGGETQKEVLVPLKAADWPTPLPATPLPSPTPFPKITLAPTASAQPPLGTPTALPDSAATPTPLSMGGASYSGSVEDLSKQVTALSGGLSPVAAAMVVGDKVDVRQGPGTSYPSLGVAEPTTLAAVLGKNAGGDWLYVLTISQLQGWVPVSSLRVTGALEKAPVLPANPLAGLAPKAAPASPAGAAAGGASAVSPTQGSQPLALESLTVTTTARVDNDSINLRQGPGAAYALLGTAARGDQVSVLALNMTKDWALVKTAQGQYAWASLGFLAVDGSLADVVQVRSPAPGGDFPADQVAPIFPAEAPTGAAAPANAGSVSAGPAAQPQAASVSQAEPAVFGGELKPLATAHVKVGDTYLYRGPATTYETVVKLAVDESLAVLAVNQQRDWALVKPANHGPGWGLVSDLDVAGSLTSAPAVVTAWVASNDLKLRSGPGIYFGEAGRLAINDLVVVLGVNAGRSWALIRPALGGGTGWIGVDFLKLGGVWAAMPQAPQPQVATAAQASVPAPAGPPQGKLVIGLASGGDIVAINADGSGLRRLTSGIDPALSPDGQRVAVTRWDGAEMGTLYVINADGSGERAVLGETKQAKHPAWSPDGQQVVVNFQHEGRLDPREECVNAMELNGKAPSIPYNVDRDSVRVKIKDGMPFLCWTLPPDPHWGLRTVEVAGGSYADMPSDLYAFGPEWDPANAWRVVSSGLNGLVQVDVTQKQQSALTDRREDRTPVFSPDGRYLAVAYAQNGGYDIFRLNGDGSGRVRLTETPLWVTAGPGEHKPWNNVAPAWSPDGTRIAFLTDRSGRWEVWVMNADGADPHALFSDGVNQQLQFTYDFVDERVLSWR